MVAVLGDLHYNILLNDGRVWKIHVEQMRSIGEVNSSNATTHQNVPVPNNDNGERNVNPDNDEGNIHLPVSTDEPEAESQQNNEAENSCSSGGKPTEPNILRRSAREKRPP